MTANVPPGLNQALGLASQLLPHGHPAAAEEVLRPLLMHGIKDELVPMLAMIRLQQGRFPEAAQMFERARAISPRDARFSYLHGAALAGGFARERVEQYLLHAVADARGQCRPPESTSVLGQLSGEHLTLRRCRPRCLCRSKSSARQRVFRAGFDRCSTAPAQLGRRTA